MRDVKKNYHVIKEDLQEQQTTPLVYNLLSKLQPTPLSLTSPVITCKGFDILNLIAQ